MLTKLILPLTIFVSAAHAETLAKFKLSPAKASLVMEVESAAPGEPIDVALRFVIEPKWHVYWKNPGDSGTPPGLKWNLTNGVFAEEIRWPFPNRIEIPPFVNYGYEKEVLLLSRVHIPASAKPGTKISLKTKADWLVCQESCIPGKADLSLVVPITAKRGRWNSWHDAFEKVRSEIPAAHPEWKVQAQSGERLIRLTVSGPNPPPPELLFFPWNAQEIENAALQKSEAGPKQTVLTVAWDAQRQESPRRMQGVLVSSRGWGNSRFQSIWIDVPVETSTTPVPSMDASVWQMFLFAVLGGLILNLMPCVFPVLSIKILSFVEQAGKAKNKIRNHGWAFSLGVMISFWILSGALILLRASGEKLGWGFQLQSPMFIFALSALLFFLSMNLLGLFDLGTQFMGVGNSLSGSAGYRGSFFTGVLATVVATPCTAPFMGASIGYALSQPPLVSLFVFTGVGAGMALPYLVLSHFPGLLKFLPKPGRWMETLKQFMAFPLLATVIWLVWVFGLQTGMDGVLRLLAALLSFGVAVWMHHRFRSAKKASLMYLFCGAFLIGGAALGIAATRMKAARTESGTDATGIPWERFSPERVKELNAQGKPVFVDFTAAWCVSCQVNEKLIFSSAEVVNTFKELNVVMMKADWTDGDDVITEELAKFGRSGVPFYLLYGKTVNGAPQQLPEVLTPDIVLAALKKI